MIHLLKAASNTDLFLFVSKTGKETFGCPADRSAVGENHHCHAGEPNFQPVNAYLLGSAKTSRTAAAFQGVPSLIRNGLSRRCYATHFIANFLCFLALSSRYRSISP